MALPERSGYAESIIYSIFNAPAFEKEFINGLTVENKLAFKKYQKNITQRAKNFLLFGFNPNIQDQCLSFIGSQIHVIGEEVYSRVQEVEGRKEPGFNSAMAGYPKTNKSKSKNQKDWKKKHTNQDNCDIYGGAYHRLTDCPKLKGICPEAPIFQKKKHPGMVAEHAIMPAENDPRDLGVCATYVPDSDITKYEWILDSGCTVHVTHYRHVFTSFKPSNKSSLKGVDGEINIYGYGDVKIGRVTLSYVAYASDLPYNLLSVQKAISKSAYLLMFDVDKKVRVLDKRVMLEL